MSECLFCKISKGEIPSSKVFENENVYAFNDINPLAKQHYLFISKNHSKNFMQMENKEIVHVLEGIKDFVKENNLEEQGFRVVTNTNKLAGQTVFHTHFHVLAGEQLKGFGA
jgi:histidine triad (HIT) family protein